jgi:IS30 family transposase
MTGEQKQTIAEFRQYAAEHGCNLDHLTDEDLYDKVTRMSVAIQWSAERIGKALREIMAAISRALKTKTAQDRQRRLYYRKKKSQQRNWRKRKRVRK